MSKIYTKTGDKGETSILSGSRVLKDHLAIESYGTLDELIVKIGKIGLHLAEYPDFQFDHELMTRLQNILFGLGSNLACPVDKREEYKLPQIDVGEITNLENRIDEIDQYLPQLKNFILPGGSDISIEAHECRVHCRYVERRMVEAAQLEDFPLPVNSLELINRLSDYFFTLARGLNFKLNKPETIWKP